MSYTIHSPEFQLAICCASLQNDEAHQILKNLIHSTSWSEEKFLKFLSRHRVVELASQVLIGETNFSVDFISDLERQKNNNQLKAIHVQFLQIRLQEFFNQKNIDSIFLKGISVAFLYYGDIGIRNVFDIDFWVHSGRFLEVEEFLESIGYLKVNNRYSFNAVQLKYLKHTSHHEVFYSPSNPELPIIEVHWRIRNALGNFRYHPEKEKANLMSYNLNGLNFSVLNHIDQFIFLSVHGAEHGWYRLKWMADLFHMVRSTDFDWCNVLLRSKELKSLKEVKLACYFLTKYFHLDLTVVMKQLNFTFCDKLRIRYIEKCIVYDGDYCDTRTEKLKNALYQLSLNRRWYISRILVLKNLTRPEDWMILKLPPSLFFLYFPLRPILWMYRNFKA